MPAQLDVLFIFAHQDDEVGAVATIAREVRNGNRCWLLYLTDGGKQISSAVRDTETETAVRRIGGTRAKAIFLNDIDGRISDGQLLSNLSRGARMVMNWIETASVLPNCVYTIDWEGGHVDHDAAHLVSLSVAKMSGTTVRAFSLYNGYGRPAKFFRVRCLVPVGGEIERFPVPWRTAFMTACAPLWYPSQWRTWMALAPGFIARALVDRQERFRKASLARTERRPHPGKLLYETLFNESYEAFEMISRPFRESIR